MAGAQSLLREAIALAHSAGAREFGAVQEFQQRTCELQMVPPTLLPLTPRSIIPVAHTYPHRLGCALIPLSSDTSSLAPLLPRLPSLRLPAVANLTLSLRAHPVLVPSPIRHPLRAAPQPRFPAPAWFSALTRQALSCFWLAGSR
eukprot:3637338-Rhodomonas_salina.1